MEPKAVDPSDLLLRPDRPALSASERAACRRVLASGRYPPPVYDGRTRVVRAGWALVEVAQRERLPYILAREASVTYRATTEQAETIERALAAVRLLEDDSEISDGRCLELVCADFLAGV